MIKCKGCDKPEHVVKAGKVRGKQRYKCKECNFYFVIGDERSSEQIAALKALCVLLYSLGHESCDALGKLFGRDGSLIYRWIKRAGLSTGEVVEDGSIKQMTFDELKHFLGSKKTEISSSKPLIVADGELWPGCLATVALRFSEDSAEK